jgi:putative addiction module component (TIGR02574 family)
MGGPAAALARGAARPEVTGMSARPILEEILRLPPDQRLQLVEDIWESLAASPTDVPVPDWHRELLDERLADPREQPALTWEEVQAAARRGRR